MADTRVTVRAYTKDFYHRDILVLDADQVRMSDTRVKDSMDGPRIYPADFPEISFFEVLATEYNK